MAGNTKAIVKDLDAKPAPQYFNPTLDQYEYLLGRNGANRVELYGPDGSPISTDASNKLAVRATELESILTTTIQGYIDGLEAALGEVQASPTAYTVLARLKDLADRLGEVSSTPTANTVLARLKTLEGYLDGVEAALGTITNPEAAGDGTIIAILKRIRTLVSQGIVTLGSATGTLAMLVAGSDGTNARAVKTAADGTLLTQLTGSTVQLAQRIPDLRTCRYEITTVADAVSVPAGGNTGAKLINDVTDGTPTEIWILVNIDKQPWTLQASSIDNTSPTSMFTAAFWPQYSSHTTIYVTAAAKAVYLGWTPAAGHGITTPPANLIEARQYIIPPRKPAYVSIINNSAETATVTIRVLKIWR